MKLLIVLFNTLICFYLIRFLVYVGTYIESSAKLHFDKFNSATRPSERSEFLFLTHRL